MTDQFNDFCEWIYKTKQVTRDWKPSKETIQMWLEYQEYIDKKARKEMWKKCNSVSNIKSR